MSSLTPIVEYGKITMKERFTRTWYFETWFDKIILTIFFSIGVFSTIYFIVRWFI